MINQTNMSDKFLTNERYVLRGDTFCLDGSKDEYNWRERSGHILENIL